MSRPKLRATFAVPGDLATPSGGYAYARALLAAAPAAEIRLDHLALPGGFPSPDAATVIEAARRLAAAPSDRPLLMDGLAFGAMPAAALAEIRAPLAALVHHPLALEGGLDAATAERLLESERAALGLAGVIVTPSAATADAVTEMFGVPRDRIRVAPPGLTRRPRAEGGDPPTILSVGSLIPRKGHDVLIDALGRIADLRWRAVLRGTENAAPDWAAELRRRAAAAGLAKRIEFRGAGTHAELDEDFRRADLFCLPSRHEGYGMVFAEAMSAGLPVVAADIPAAREAIADGGALAPVDDATALAGALGRLLSDPETRAAASEAALARADRLPGWDATARIVADALREIAP